MSPQSYKDVFTTTGNNYNCIIPPTVKVYVDFDEMAAEGANLL